MFDKVMVWLMENAKAVLVGAVLITLNQGQYVLEVYNLYKLPAIENAIVSTAALTVAIVLAVLVILSQQPKKSSK